MATQVQPDPAQPAAPAAAPASPATGVQPTGEKPFDPDVVVDELIESKGGGYQGARLAALKLLRDKGKGLEKIRALRQRVVEDGAVVLRGEELATFNKLKALNLTPEQITAKLTEHATLQNEVKSSKQERFFDEVAEAMGFRGKGKKVFARLAKMNGIEIQMKDVEVEDADGTKRTEKKPFARLATDTAGDFKALDMYLDEEFGEFRPALYAEDDGSDAGDLTRTGDSGSSRGHAPERKVTPMATQSGSSRTRAEPAERGAVKSVLDRKYAPPKPAT